MNNFDYCCCLKIYQEVLTVKISELPLITTPVNFTQLQCNVMCSGQHRDAPLCSRERMHVMRIMI